MIGYGLSFVELYRRAAYFVDRIVKGTTPADLPMEQPTIFELVVDQRPRYFLGLGERSSASRCRSGVFARADRVRRSSAC